MQAVATISHVLMRQSRNKRTDGRTDMTDRIVCHVLMRLNVVINPVL